jgi:hypothetical protein
VPFRNDLGGAYFVAKPLKEQYDALVGRVENLKADILEARIDETEAKREINELQLEIVQALDQIEKSQVYVSAVETHRRTDSQTFELGEHGCLFVESGKVRIVGWDRPEVKWELEKTVLAEKHVPVDDDFEGIQVAHHRAPANEVLGLPSAESFDELDLARLANYPRYFLVRYRAVARSDPQLLARLDPKVAALVTRDDEPDDEKLFATRLAFEQLVGKELDVVRLTGLTHEEGNRQFYYTLTSPGAEGRGGYSTSGMQWRRHASLTLYVPTCSVVAVRGALEGLDVESLHAALEIVGEGNRDYEAAYRITDLNGPLTVTGVPVRRVENVRGDVSVVLTAYSENAGTTHRARKMTHSHAGPTPCVYKNIEGNVRAWFCRADLHLEDVAGKIDVRNDFGNTVLVCSDRLANVAHRVVSESGHIEVKLGPEALDGLAVTALTECGRVEAPDQLPELRGRRPRIRSSSFTTSEGYDGVRRSWGGFVSRAGDYPSRPFTRDPFEAFRRPAESLAGRDRSPGLDLISRAGSVKLVSIE